MKTFLRLLYIILILYAVQSGAEEKKTDLNTVETITSEKIRITSETMRVADNARYVDFVGNVKVKLRFRFNAFADTVRIVYLEKGIAQNILLKRNVTIIKDPYRVKCNYCQIDFVNRKIFYEGDVIVYKNGQVVDEKLENNRFFKKIAPDSFLTYEYQQR